MLTLVLLIVVAIRIALTSYEIKTDTVEDDTVGGLIFLKPYKAESEGEK